MRFKTLLTEIREILMDWIVLVLGDPVFSGKGKFRLAFLTTLPTIGGLIIS